MGLLDRTNLDYMTVREINANFTSNPIEHYRDIKKTIKDWINFADKRGDDTFTLTTQDGFTVFERFYRHNTNGTKDVVSEHYLKENELTPREAVEAMLNHEILEDFVDKLWSYKWNGKYFIKDGGYYIDNWEPISEFTGLKRQEKNNERGKKGVKEMSAKKTTAAKPNAKKVTKKATAKAKTPAKTKAALKGKQRPK